MLFVEPQSSLIPMGYSVEQHWRRNLFIFKSMEYIIRRWTFDVGRSLVSFIDQTGPSAVSGWAAP
jgi:hypothetical protein